MKQPKQSVKMLLPSSTPLLVLGVTLTLHLLVVSGQNEFADCLGLVQFIAVNEEVDFETARTRCEGLNATLARISNEEEHNFVGDFLNSVEEIGSNDNFWIGLEDVDSVGGTDPTRFTFVDLSQEGLDFFDQGGVFPWLGSQPNDLRGDQDCLE